MMKLTLLNLVILLLVSTLQINAQDNTNNLITGVWQADITAIEEKAEQQLRAEYEQRLSSASTQTEKAKVEEDIEQVKIALKTKVQNIADALLSFAKDGILRIYTIPNTTSRQYGKWKVSKQGKMLIIKKNQGKKIKYKIILIDQDKMILEDLSESENSPFKVITYNKLKKTSN